MLSSDKSAYFIKITISLLILVMSGCANSKSDTPPITSAPTPESIFIEDDGLFEDDGQLEDDGLFEDDDDDLFNDDSPIETVEQTEISDPFYYFNKAMFHVNDKLYFGYYVQPP